MGKIRKDSIIKLKWAKDENSKFYNFGDDLAPYLINKLSGCSIEYIRYANSRYSIFKIFLVKLLTGNFKVSELNDFSRSLKAKYYIISIGSIIQWYSSSRCIVWGSGIISKNAKIKNSTFLAVRGDYTKRRLKELDFKPPQVIGDPALLLPLVYKPIIKKKYKLGIIPHITHYDLFKEKELPDDVLLINLNSNKIEAVVDDILMCDSTISTSLHGIIVSQAYDIKSLWFSINGKELFGDNIKFYDYFSSVGIQEYKPFKLKTDKIDFNEINRLFENLNAINTIQVDLSELQRNLISVAPFEIKDEFRK